MRTGWFVGIAAAAVVLDSAVAPEIEIFGARPDFLVLVVAYAALVLGARPATVMGFVLGLIVDAEQPEYLGLHALALSLIGYVTAGAWEHLVRSSVFVQVSVLFSASLAHDVIYYVVYYRNHMDMYGRFLGRFGLVGGLYTAALGALVYAAARARGSRSLAGGIRA